METSNSAVLGNPLTTFYLAALDLLDADRLPFLVGGTFAYARYTAIDRETKDLDIFVRPEDVPRTLSAFEAAGYRTEVPFPHWLAKVWQGEHVLDVIYSSGNGLARVDDEWFAHAAESEVLGRRLRLCPLEELVWSQGVRAGTRAVRRGGRAAPPSRCRTRYRLAAAGRPVWRLLAGAPQPSRVVPLRLPRPP